MECQEKESVSHRCGTTTIACAPKDSEISGDQKGKLVSPLVSGSCKEVKVRCIVPIIKMGLCSGQFSMCLNMYVVWRIQA